jgi:rSAM/selenodomain-associated transferase 1
MSSCTVIVMAKAPVAGFAKTRLIPALGAEGAAALARRLLDHAIDQALAAGLGPVELCAAPDAAHAAFEPHAQRAGLRLSPQGDGGLGERMNRAFLRNLSATTPALMIGTDAPAVDANVLRAAAQALQDQDAVFVPAHDGGYALVGLRRPAPSIFTGVAWSTAQVMAQTRQRLAACGLHHAELAPVHDIDEPADLQHLPAAWRSQAA